MNWLWGPLRLLAIAAACLAAGCAHLPQPAAATRGTALHGGRPDLCCTNAARYPEWLIKMADPFAPVVGRALAAVVWRRGYLAQQEAARDRIEARLRPTDIVLVSSKGRLTGRAIPGLFGHAAVYLGSEAELRSLGIWDDERLKPYRQAIRSGAVMIEADRKGVHLSSPDRVLDTDRVVVLRPQLPSAKARRNAALGYVEHVGTRFDFRFDSDESERLFCAELVYHVLPELGVPTRHVYGRDTVIPDDIVAKGLRTPYRLAVVLYVRPAARYGRAPHRRRWRPIWPPPGSLGNPSPCADPKGLANHAAGKQQTPAGGGP